MGVYNLPNNIAIYNMFNDKSQRELNQNDEQRIYKGLPVGSHLFSALSMHNCFYADKTPIIEHLELCNATNVFIHRPKGLGKTTFLAMLKAYYDVCSSTVHEQLFSNLAICNKKYSTAHSFCILEFDFGNIHSPDEFKLEVINSIKAFCAKYHIDFQIEGYTSICTMMLDLFNTYISQEHFDPIYVFIDNYDSFDPSNPYENYQNIIAKPFNLQKFYNTLKTAESRGIVSRTISLGILPICNSFKYLDIEFEGIDYTFDARYTDAIGLTEYEVSRLIKETLPANKQSLSLDEITEHICSILDGHSFSDASTCRIINTRSCLRQLTEFKEPSPIVRENFKLHATYKIIESFFLTFKNEIMNIEQNLRKTHEFVLEERLNLWSDNTTVKICSFLYFCGILTIRTAFIKPNGDYSLILRITNKTILEIWRYVIQAKR